MEIVHEILPGLYIGNARFSRNRDELERLEITHILNCAKELQCWYIEVILNQDFVYFKLPFKDTLDQRILEDLSITTRFIDEALTNRKKVLVHCYAGVSRSASVVIAYVMFRQRVNLDSALCFVLEKHSNTRPNASFLEQLGQYESQLLLSN